MEEKRMAMCECCGEYVPESLIIEHGGSAYCEDCFFDNFAYCDLCGDVEPIENMVYIESEERYVCEWCASNNYVQCYECGEYVRNYYTRWLDGEEYCEDCFERYSVWCECCEEYVHTDNYDWDRDCCEECASRLIGGYHSHRFYKVGNTSIEENIFHKGIELEVENIKRNTSNHEMVEMISKLYEHIVFDQDGSLNDGFDIITQPHTFEMFNKIPWESILQVCSSNGFRSHDTSTCGLHIHYSREFFGMETELQADNIGKLIAFYERHLNDLLKLSRRTWGNYQRWARGYDTEGDIEKCKECAKDRNNDRYRYINLSNSNTVEFRLARGTLNVDTFNAWNDLHDCIVKNVKNVSYEDIDNLETWFKGIKTDTVLHFIKKEVFVDFIEVLRTKIFK